MATEDLVEQLCEWLDEARSKTFPAFRNLREIQPGFPSTTPGNGDPGGGGGGHGPSIVERMLDDDGNIRPDDAEADLASATDLLHRMKPLVQSYRDLVLRWGYTTAGEHHVGVRRQPGRPTEGDSARARWCTHHEKFGIAEPRGSYGRGGLCGWCYRWQLDEGELPPGSLVQYRQDYGKLSTPVIDAWRKQKARAAAAEAQRVKKRVKKKRARR